LVLLAVSEVGGKRIEKEEVEERKKRGGKGRRRREKEERKRKRKKERGKERKIVVKTHPTKICLGQRVCS
jgi:hypothetical protein